MPHVPGHGENYSPGGPDVMMADPYLQDGPLGMAELAPSLNVTASGLPINRSNPYGIDTGLANFDNVDLSALGGSGNLRDLFGRLNMISLRNQAGAGSGGGTTLTEGNMDANPLIALNEYMGKNVTSFDKGGALRSIYDQGGQLSPKEMKKVQGLGRNGDTQLAHINPQEAAMLKAMGGSGTINPYTGLPEYFGFFNFISDVLGSAGDVVGDVMGGVSDVVSPIINPVFDAAGEVLDPVADIAHEGVSAAGGLVENVIETGSDVLIDGVKTLGFDVAMPLFEGIVNPINDILSGLVSGGDTVNPYQPSEPKKIQREAVEKQPETQMSNVKPANTSVLSKIKKDSDPVGLREGDWVGEKDNPFVTPNVEEQLDYAAKGMKMPKYDEGGHYTQQANQAIAMNQLSGLVANAMNKRNMMMAKGGSFKPHMMYSPKTGEGFKAEKLQDHLDMKEKGYDHRKRNPENYPKAAYGMKMKKRYTNGGRF